MDAKKMLQWQLDTCQNLAVVESKHQLNEFLRRIKHCKGFLETDNAPHYQHQHLLLD